MRSIFFVDRTGLYYYGGNVHALAFFLFPQGSVVDLELVNEADLKAPFAEWIKTNKVEPTLSGIVFATNSTFQKEIPLDTLLEKKDEIKKLFVDYVPFNDTLTSEFMLEKSILIVVGNQTLAFALRDMIQSAGFTIETISPVASIYGIAPVNAIDVNVAQEILNKSSLLKTGSFSLLEKIDPDNVPDETAPKEKKHQREYLLIGVLVFCIIALIIVYFSFMSPPAVQKTPLVRGPIQRPAAQSTPPALPTESTLVSSSSATFDTSKKHETIQIKVLNGSGIPGQADTIKSRLEEKGFVSIDTGNAPTLETSKALVIFKSTVSDKDRKDIVNIMEFYFEGVSVQDKDDIDPDVLLTTSKSTNSQPFQ